MHITEDASAQRAGHHVHSQTWTFATGCWRITFSGNHYFQRRYSDLRGCNSSGRRFASRGRFSQRMVRDDADSIRGLYQANGFLAGPSLNSSWMTTKGEIGDLYVHYLDHGRPANAGGGLKIEGNHTIDARNIGQCYRFIGRASRIRIRTSRVTATIFWRSITTTDFPTRRWKDRQRLAPNRTG